jgi:hypothetical protein
VDRTVGTDRRGATVEIVDPAEQTLPLVRAARSAPDARRRGDRPPIGVAPRAPRGAVRAGALANHWPL